ncbi:MAG: hypothetical protein GTO02_05370 [Candidatus Dadabacteria bacterium]|nr:hypothetical protein [Candidatus Dadabacteria bacterium]NIQ13837.1 hypothetical protein [Candidatus Dadabacteria bacterium]
MNKEKMIGDYERTKKVILSCQNIEQLRVGVKMFNQLNKLHDLSDKELDVLENLIGLMRIKCMGGEDDVNEGKSQIGKEFHKAAQASGINDLRSIVFSEEEKVEGGKADDMAPEDLAEKHGVDLKDIEKEIEVGVRIEMEHTDDKEIAKEIAMDHIFEFPDYYTDPNYGLVAVEDIKGENKKMIRVSKDEIGRLEKERKLSTDDFDLSYKEDLSEDLDSNEISQRLRDQLKQRTSRRFSKDEIFAEIRRRREEEMDRRRREMDDYQTFVDNEFTEYDDEEEIDEATSAMSSGSFVAPLGGKPISRTFKKSEIPVSVSGLDKPIGKGYSYRKEVLEEDEELDEATSVGSVGGQYETPKFWAKGKGNWRNRVKKAYPGGKFVNIKKKCKNYPYCDQGSGGPSGSPITLTDTSQMKIDGYFNESRVVKTIKKGNLKIKK